MLLGLLLLVSGLGMLWLDQSLVAAQDILVAQEDVDLSDADYIGAGECASCHRDLARTHDDSRHALTLQDASRDSDVILGDFSAGEDVRQVTFPEDDESRAFDADDIAFVIGTGRYVQRYLYEVDRRDYRVLPAEWDVINGQWRRLELADSWDDPAYDWETNCAYCHTTGLNVERGAWEDDGVQCEACHGPGSIHEELASDAGRRPDEEELAEIRAAINPALDPQVCGQCHSRGETADGLPFPHGYLPGTDLEDVFTLTATDQTDHWWLTGHASQPNMQYNEWVNSTHASALDGLLSSERADTACLTCHSADYAHNLALAAAVESGDREGSAPEPVTLDSAEFGVTCISCHNPHAEVDPDEDTTEATYTLCATCHSNSTFTESTDVNRVHYPVREMFEGQDFVEGVSGVVGVHFAAEDGPRCATCHLPEVPVDDTAGSGGSALRLSHTFEPILAFNVEGLEDSCSGCHGQQAGPEAMGQLVESIQTSTQTRLDAALALVDDSTVEWVGNALNFVERDGSLGIHNYAYTAALLNAVETELGLSPEPITEPDLSSLLSVAPPPEAQIATEPFTGQIGGGLTAPSIILLGIAALLIGFAGYSFFFRRPQ